MFVRTSICCLVALSAAACANEPSQPDDGEKSGQAPAPTPGKTEPARAIEHAAPAPPGMVEVERQTSDGERIRVYVPEMAPNIEVPEGSQCGKKNAQGAYLSCRPGLSCVSPAEGVAGTCEAAPRAPPSEG